MQMQINLPDNVERLVKQFMYERDVNSKTKAVVMILEECVIKEEELHNGIPNIQQ